MEKVDFGHLKGKTDISKRKYQFKLEEREGGVYIVTSIGNLEELFVLLDSKGSFNFEFVNQLAYRGYEFRRRQIKGRVDIWTSNLTLFILHTENLVNRFSIYYKDDESASENLKIRIENYKNGRTSFCGVVVYSIKL